MNRLNNAVSTHNGFLSCMALIALAMLLATGCSSSKRALKQGDYAKATLEAAKHLRKHPRKPQGTRSGGTPHALRPRAARGQD